MIFDNWDQVEQAVSSCENCRLCETRIQTVLGAGNPKAPILLVGEGPGENEDKQGIPFVGRGGQLLDKLLLHVGLSREKDVYITNMVKCRPPKNRNPMPDEQEACIDYLRSQTALIRPKIIVCLGRIAACKLISPDFKVTSQHGQFFERNNVLLTATFHPASVLRNPPQRGLTVDDFIAIKEKLDELLASELGRDC